MMKKSFGLVMILSSAMALASCGDSATPDQAQAAPAPVIEAQPAAPRFTAAQIEAAKAALAEEPKIKDVLAASPDDKYSVDWQIGVLPDGTSRVGYAQYVCGRLAELKLVDEYTDVRIVDLPALEANAGDFRAASLGHVNCNDGTDLGA